MTYPVSHYCTISFQTQAQRRTGGTGLGLYALSKRLESLGGNCGVKDRSDGASGSCFWISIPFKPDEMGEAEGEASLTLPLLAAQDFSAPPREEEEANAGIAALMSGFIKQDKIASTGDDEPGETVPPLRIMLVDDSSLIRKATSRALIKEGHQVEVAQHGAECIKLLEASILTPCEYGFDLILMDLQMPVMDGLEATRRIRALEYMKSTEGGARGAQHILIVGVTANTEVEARVDCLESGMDGFMEKPLKIKDFQNYVATLRNWGSAV